MKRKLLSLFLLLGLTLSVATACTPPTADNSSSSSPPAIQEVDYVSQLKLNMNSETKKQEVTVENFVDGDTTHFKVPTTINERGILKARYIAVNTPESTGKIEEWGKKASNHTKNALKNAQSIIIETDGTDWERDSTNERYLVWVWYKPQGENEYRNLNLELLQNGLAVGSKAGSTRYGETCNQAIYQASVLQLHVHSKEKDPDYFYGEAISVSLKELRLNIEDYTNKRVVFEGTVAQYYNQGVYVEDYDEESDMYFGIYVYYGFFLSSHGQTLLVEGNRVRIAGNVQYYETGDSYQVSDVEYDPFDLESVDNIKLISKNNPVANVETSIETFTGNKTLTLTVIDEETGDESTEEKVFSYAELALNTSISMKGLKVIDAYTTNNGGNNDGAITLTCEVNGKRIKVRTGVFYNEDKQLITEDYYMGKTLDVVGVVDYFSGDYQIEVFTLKDVNVH